MADNGQQDSVDQADTERDEDGPTLWERGVLPFEEGTFWGEDGLRPLSTQDITAFFAAIFQRTAGLDEFRESPATRYAQNQRNTALTNLRSDLEESLDPDNPADAQASLIQQRMRARGFTEDIPIEILEALLVNDDYITVNEDDGGRSYNFSSLFGALNNIVTTENPQFQAGPVTLNFAEAELDAGDLSFMASQIREAYSYQMNQHYTAYFSQDLREYFESMIANGELELSDEEAFLQIIEDAAYHYDVIEQGRGRDPSEFQQRVFADMRAAGISLTYQPQSDPHYMHLTTRMTLRAGAVPPSAEDSEQYEGPGRASDATRDLTLVNWEEGMSAPPFFDEWVERMHEAAEELTTIIAIAAATEDSVPYAQRQAQEYAGQQARAFIETANEEDMSRFLSEAGINLNGAEPQVMRHGNYSVEYNALHERYEAEFDIQAAQEARYDDVYQRYYNAAYDQGMLEAYREGLREFTLGDKANLYLRDIDNEILPGLRSGDITGQQVFDAMITRTGMVEIYNQGIVFEADEVVAEQIAALQESGQTGLINAYQEQLESIHHKMASAGDPSAMQEAAMEEPEVNPAAPEPTVAPNGAAAPGI